MTHRAACRRAGWAAMVPLLLAAECDPASDKRPQVPERALGVWVTESPAMAERVFEITPTELFFQSGPDSYTLH
ncbi:MAG: hypothetical protein HKO53_00500, partial [Gemmatimonadetes bacterium]|nr:hypothetical protein [Gemmatimonadota bacterium]